MMVGSWLTRAQPSVETKSCLQDKAAASVSVRGAMARLTPPKWAKIARHDSGMLVSVYAIPSAAQYACTCGRKRPRLLRGHAEKLETEDRQHQRDLVAQHPLDPCWAAQRLFRCACQKQNVYVWILRGIVRPGVMGVVIVNPPGAAHADQEITDHQPGERIPA